MNTRSENSKTLTLFGGGAAGFGLPVLSPYVTKAEVQLMMAGVPYRNAQAFPTMGPKGKIPYIEDEGAVVGDSTFIRAHIEKKYGVDLDAALTPRERAEAWAIERMMEDHLAWASTHHRWLIPENFAKGPGTWFNDASPEKQAQLRADIQKRVSDTMRAHGMGRHTPEEIAELGTRSLSALSVLLGDKTYLMGEKPSAVDATALGILAGILTPFFDSPLRRAAEGFDNLVAYTERMMRRYYPDHPWPSRQRAEAAPSRKPMLALVALG